MGPEENKNKKVHFKNKYAKMGFIAFMVVACSIMFYFLFFEDHTLFGLTKKILSSLTPFFVGAILAYLLKPICEVFEKWLGKLMSKAKNKRKARTFVITISAILSLLMLLLLIYVLFAAVIPQVVDSVKMLVDTLPETWERITSWAVRTAEGTPLEEPVNDFATDSFATIQKIMDSVMGLDTGKIVISITNGLKGVLSILENIIVGAVACIYILTQRKKLAAQGKMIIYSIFKENVADKVMEEIKYVDKMFSGFINGKIIDSLIIGVITFIVTSIFKIPYAMLVSVIVGVTNVIPFFGPWIGAVPSCFIVLMVSPMKALYLAIMLIVIQQFDGNILGPKILGNTTGLSSFWVLFSIVFFGGLFGFVGMIIGVPLFAVIYDVVKRLVMHGLEKRKKQDMYENYMKERKIEQRAKLAEKRRKQVRIKKVVFNKKKK